RRVVWMTPTAPNSELSTLVLRMNFRTMRLLPSGTATLPGRKLRSIRLAEHPRLRYPASVARGGAAGLAHRFARDVAPGGERLSRRVLLTDVLLREGGGLDEQVEPGALVLDLAEVDLGDDVAGPVMLGEPAQRLGDGLGAVPRHEVLVVDVALVDAARAVAQVDVTQPGARRDGVLERIASGERGVREVERHRRDIHVGRVGARGVGLEVLAADLPREHVLDGDLDARTCARLPDDA